MSTQGTQSVRARTHERSRLDGARGIPWVRLAETKNTQGNAPNSFKEDLEGVRSNADNFLDGEKK